MIECFRSIGRRGSLNVSRNSLEDSKVRAIRKSSLSTRSSCPSAVATAKAAAAYPSMWGSTIVYASFSSSARYESTNPCWALRSRLCPTTFSARSIEMFATSAFTA